jgi:competence protein ComEC
MPGQNALIADKSRPNPRYQPLVIVLAAASAGIAGDRFCPLGVWLWMALAGTSMFVWWRLSRRGSSRIASAVLLLAIASAAGSWHHCRWNWCTADNLGNFTPSKAEPVCLEAVALGAPRELPAPPLDSMQSMRREPCFRLEIAPLAVRDRDQWKPISGQAELLVQGAAPKIAAGDRLKIFGKLSTPVAAHNPGDFDYAAYLRGRHVRAEIQAKTVECVSLLAPGSTWNPTRLLDRLRLASGGIFRRYLDPEQADLASAMMLGERERIDPEQKENFMVTGTIHVIVIAGLHVGVLAGALVWLMRLVPLPRLLKSAAVVFIIGAYTLMVEVNPPIVRAAILVFITCGSLWLYRRTLGFNNLAAAGLVVLALNPNDLFNVGAQLSFLAVGAMIWFGTWRREKDQLDRLADITEKRLFFFSASLSLWRRRLGDLLRIGIAIWLVTTPLVMARFHIFSPAAMLMNSILWVPLTLGLLAGFALLLCGTIFPPLADCCALVCNTNLWLLEKSVRLAERTPGSHFWVAGPSDWWLAVLYGGLAVALCCPAVRPPRRWSAALLAGWIAVGLLVSLAGRNSGKLQCTFVSVGHGSATVVELPSGQTLLCDAGRMGAPTRAAHSIAGYLWSRGITHLDAVVLSHADIDHFNGLPDLLKKFSVGVVYVSPMMFADQTPSIKALKAALDSRQTPCKELRAGQRLPGGEHCRIEVLHPPRRGIVGSHNANSLVLAIDYRGRRILLPGDLEAPGMNDLLTEEPLPCTVLLAPHHGSRQSNSPELAAWCKPQWIVLSGDGRWSTPEIDATYAAVSGRTLHTYLDGAITFTFDEKGTKVEKFLNGK